jgi:hypothetical protein
LVRYFSGECGSIVAVQLPTRRHGGAVIAVNFETEDPKGINLRVKAESR